jgi:hypothetical protein
VSAPLSDDLLRDIEEKAKAATPGPWTAHTPAWRTGFVHGAHSYEVASGLHHYDAHYLAAAQPSVVLALLERLKKAEAVKTAWAEQNAHIEHATRCETSRQHYGARADGWPDLLDPRCDCGLRELVLALEAL